jgi:hypothetical protein
VTLATEAQAAFFSYSREDSEFALRLAGDLKAAGAAVWLDQLDIDPGQRWDRTVEDALTHCRRLLVILSPASVNSTNVMDEVSFALETQKTVIPVLYRECAIPFRLRRVQYIDFRTDYAAGLKGLLKTLRAEPQIVAASEPSESLVPGNKRAAEQSKQETVAGEKITGRLASESNLLSKFPAWAKVALAMCAVLIIASALYWAFSGQHPSKQTEEVHTQQSPAAAPNPSAISSGKEQQSQAAAPIPQVTSGSEAEQRRKIKWQARGRPGAVSEDRNESPPKVVAQESSLSPPAVMHVCDPVGTCATWTWNNGHYDGVWKNGVTATLTVISFSPQSVMIKRTDTGNRVGYAYLYTGKVSSQGDSILNGEWSGIAGSRQEGVSGHFTAAWGAALPKTSLSPPAVMRVCADPRDYSRCSTWTWTNGHYDGWREWGAIATMTVESFTPESVVIRRRDTGQPGPGHPGAGFTAVYVGQISAQGDRILNGQVRDNRGGVGPFRAYWGAALRDVLPAK